MEYVTPKCRNCHQAFSLTERKFNRLPLLLRCAHCFCGDCIEQLARAQDRKGLSCPECASHTPLAYDEDVHTQLVPNLYVLGVLTAATLGLKRVYSFNSAPLCMNTELHPLTLEPSVEKNATPAEQKCEECGVQPVSFKCPQCVGLYCDSCFKTAHAASKSMNRHVPVSIEKMKYQPKQCLAHPEETAKLYCEDDQVVVCSECCRIGDHTDHLIHPFVEVADRHFVRLKGLLSNSLNVLKRLKDIEQMLFGQLSDIKKDFCTRSAEISNAFTGFFVHLQRREHQLLEEVTKASDSCTSQLVVHTKEVHHQISSLATVIFTVQSALASGSGDVVERGGQWSSELSKLCEIPWKFKKMKTDPISFKIDKKSVRKYLMEIGSIDYSPQPFLQYVENTPASADMATPTRPVPSPSILHSESSTYAKCNNQTMEAKNLALVPCASSQETTQDRKEYVSLSQDVTREINANPLDRGRGCRIPLQSSHQAMADSNAMQIDTQLTPTRPSPSHSPSNLQTKISWDSVEPVTVIHAMDPSEFYVQRPGDQKALQDLTAKLDEYCPSQKRPHLRTLTHGKVYGCRHTNGHWYRATLDRIIKGASQVSVFVVYLDLGCSGMTNCEGLTMLPIDLASGRRLCTKCSLADVAPVSRFSNVAPKSWTQQCINQFKSLVVDNSNIRMKVMCSDGDALCVDIFLPPEHSPMSVIGRLTRMGHIVSKKKASKSRPYPLPSISLIPGDEIEVVVSSVDSPSSFYIQPANQYQSIVDLSNQLQAEVATIQPSQLVDRAIGSLCLAVFPDDGLYYRAEILATDDRNAKVLFVDYGNWSIVPLETLLNLPPHYLDKPMQGIQCSLTGVISLDPNGTWSDDVCDTFSDLVSKSVYLLVVEGKGTPLPVSLKDIQTLEPVSLVLERLELAKSNTPVTPPTPMATVVSSPLQHAELMQESPSFLPISSTIITTPTCSSITNSLPLVPARGPTHVPQITVPTPVLPLIGTHFTATVTHITSLSDFHVVMDTQQLEQLKLSLMLNMPLSPSHTPLHTGDYCLAPFTDQELWYRVRVESLVGEELCVVKYIDYGNVATIRKLDTAPLPAECAGLPAQAIPCKLANVNLLSGTNGWDHLDGEPGPPTLLASSPVHVFSSFVMDQVVMVTVENHSVTSLEVSLTVGDRGDVVKLMVERGRHFQFIPLVSEQ